MSLLDRIRLPEALVECCCAPDLMLESSVAATQVSFLQELHKSAYRRPSIEATGLTLLDWMSSYDKRFSLELILSKFRDTLTKVNDEVADRIAKEIPDALRLANELAQEHRVVQGLEKRLTQMSTYQNKAEARFKNQTEMMSVSSLRSCSSKLKMKITVDLRKEALIIMLRFGLISDVTSTRFKAMKHSRLHQKIAIQET